MLIAHDMTARTVLMVRKHTGNTSSALPEACFAAPPRSMICVSGCPLHPGFNALRVPGLPCYPVPALFCLVPELEVQTRALHWPHISTAA